MALNKEQAQQKVKEILDLARNEKKTLTYQDVMNKLSDLDIDADAIDAVFETLESEGINVINATEDETAVLPADVTGADMDISVPEGISIDDPVRMYLKEIGKVPLLTAAEEIDLAMKIEAGVAAGEQLEKADAGEIELERRDLRRLTRIEEVGFDAKQQLIEANLRLVVSIARGYLGYGLPYADLIQEGNIGLMKAIRRYDPDRGARLMTFAQHWIRSEIQEYIIRNWRIVKLATTKNQRKLFFNLRQLKEDSQAALTHNEAERIALTLDVKPKEVLDMEERMYGQEASLDAPSDSDSDENYSPSDWLTRKSDEPEAMLEEEDKQRLEGEGLQKALASLDPRSRRVIEARYLNVDAEGNAKPVTLQALAKEFNISAERVRQIEKLAIKKMHGELAGEDPF